MQNKITCPCSLCVVCYGCLAKCLANAEDGHRHQDGQGEQGNCPVEVGVGSALGNAVVPAGWPAVTLEAAVPIILAFVADAIRFFCEFIVARPFTEMALTERGTEAIFGGDLVRAIWLLECGTAVREESTGVHIVRFFAIPRPICIAGKGAILSPQCILGEGRGSEEEQEGNAKAPLEVEQ